MPGQFKIIVQLLVFKIAALATAIQDQTSVAGISRNIHILCDLRQHDGTPFWSINDTIYEVFSIPQFFPSIPVVTNFGVLTIALVTPDLNNTVFLCESFDNSGNLRSTPESATRLIVLPNPLEPGYNQSSSKTTGKITFNYQELDVQESMTIIGWSYQNVCNLEFELQGFRLSDGEMVPSSSHVISASNLNSSTISASQVFSSLTEDEIFYRLVAVGENGIPCSDETSQNSYFRFDRSAVNQRREIPLNSTTCFTIPSSCPTSLYFVWPQRELGLSCFCPVYNSDDGRLVFASCVEGCESAIFPHLTESGQVCLDDQNYTTDGVRIYFQCSTDLCSARSCFVKDVISSYTIIIEDIMTVRIGATVRIPCDVMIQNMLGIPLWYINDTVYNFQTLPQFIPSVLSEMSRVLLTITSLPLSLNNTVFRCLNLNVDRILLGRPTRIIIDLNLVGNGGEGESNNNTLVMDFDNLKATTDVVSVQWNVINICSQNFELQGFTFNENGLEASEYNTSTTLFRASIPSDQLTDGEVPIVYRIVAARNGVLCSKERTKTTFYRFNASEPQRQFAAPNTLVCLRVPSVHGLPCTYITGTWPEGCVCPVCDHQSCRNCSNCDNPPINANSSMICLDNLEDRSVVNFLCYHRACEHCGSTISRVLASHEVVRLVPPSPPIVNFSIDSTSFCILSYLDDVLPVETITVEIDDITGIPSRITRNYSITMEPFCLEIHPDDACYPFNASFSATNSVGMSLSTTRDVNSPSDNNCLCYQKREQISLNVSSITSNSAVAILYCGLKETSNVDYSLENEQGVKMINIKCGEEKKLQNLTSNTEYSLAHYYSDEIRCSAAHFITSSGSNLIDVAIAIPTVLVFIGIVIGVVTIVLCCWWWPKRHKKEYAVQYKRTEGDEQKVTMSSP